MLDRARYSHTALAPRSSSDIDEARKIRSAICPENEYDPLKGCVPAVVENALLCPAFGCLLLLLLVDLGGLRLHFARTGERSVNCAWSHPSGMQRTFLFIFDERKECDFSEKRVCELRRRLTEGEGPTFSHTLCLL